MPEQFTVPQFLDAEDKIIGPVTLRQFVIMIVVFMVDAVLYKLLSFVIFLLVAIPVLVAGGIVAFVKINGMPFHFFLLNIVQTFKRPQLRVWDKTLNDGELRVHLKQKEAPPPPPPERKAPVAQSRLEELTLVVNTSGVYNPESE